MKVRLGFSATSIFLLLCLAAPAGWAADAVCGDIQGRDSARVNVLTINLLFSEIPNRQARLSAIADFVAARAGSSPVDVILLQEVVGGILAKTANSSVDLQHLLQARGLNYNLSYRLANGIPGLLSVGNAVLSRCQVVFTVARLLPFVTEEPFPSLNIKIPLNRQVMLTRLNVPGVGKLNVYNTHLCAFCDPVSERLKQAQVMLDFIRTMEFLTPGNGPRILGGDFNTDLNSPGDANVYAAITGRGFEDSYLAFRQQSATPCLSMSCCSNSDLQGCTYAVPGNPYVSNFPTPAGPTARIDYVFFQGPATAVKTSERVFPPVTFVSDHSGVLSAVGLK